MKIFLLAKNGPRLVGKLPHAEADHAVIEAPCPACQASPFGVAGSGKYPSQDDRAWESEGYCTACKAHVGVIRVEMNTLFGVREDEAVLSGRYLVF